MASEPYRIFIVDDLADNLFLMQTMLEASGYLVDTANNGTVALEKMQATTPDLALIDVMMPEVNGYELTRKIRRHEALRSIPIVLISAYIEACRIKGLAVGATDFIRKPIDMEELLAKLQILLNYRDTRKTVDEDITGLNGTTL